MTEAKRIHPLTLARKRCNLSQKLLAELSGVSLPTVQRAESWKPVGAESRRLLCDFFSDRFHRQVDVQELGLIYEDAQTSAEVNEQTQKGTNQPQQSLLSEQRLLEKAHGALAEYLERQQLQLLNALVPGSMNLRVGDVVSQKGLFIPPPWEELQGMSPITNLIEYLIEALIAGERILLLGDAGQGKTTILKYIFTLMVDGYLDKLHNSIPIPIYIPLREFSFREGSGLEALWNYLAEDFPLSFEDFGTLVRNGRIVFLFDGFDEIKGELTQHFINERAASKIFTYPSILSCRKSFFEFYLSMTALQEYYPQWVVLQPLTLNHSTIQYITVFCEQKQKIFPRKSITAPEKIVEIIRGNQELQDLAQRPLLLIMMLDLFTEPRETLGDDWSATKLYRKYTEKWLKNEAAKPDSVLKWYEKEMLVQEIAWLTYTAKASPSSSYRLSQNDTFTQRELSSFVKHIAPLYPHLTERQLLDDLCFRTLLAVSEGDRYYFLHKTFQEYYVAKYIYERMASREQSLDAIGHVLQEFLPFEVATFLKQMLEAKDIRPAEKDVIVDNLLRVYQHYSGDDLQSLTVRQHASHYLALVRTRRAIQFLEQAWKQEPNKWVQRGIMVGLALYAEKADVLEQYIKIIQNDAEAASINLGYHLVYYGDQAPESGYYDQGGSRCDGTLRAIFRHLKNERHKNSWILDIVTLSMLLEQRGRSILSPYEEEIAFLEEFFKKDHREHSNLLQQEKERLAKTIGEILING